MQNYIKYVTNYQSLIDENKFIHMTVNAKFCELSHNYGLLTTDVGIVKPDIALEKVDLNSQNYLSYSQISERAIMEIDYTEHDRTIFEFDHSKDKLVFGVSVNIKSNEYTPPEVDSSKKYTYPIGDPSFESEPTEIPTVFPNPSNGEENIIVYLARQEVFSGGALFSSNSIKYSSTNKVQNCKYGFSHQGECLSCKIGFELNLMTNTCDSCMTGCDLCDLQLNKCLMCGSSHEMNFNQIASCKSLFDGTSQTSPESRLKNGRNEDGCKGTGWNRFMKDMCNSCDASECSCNKYQTLGNDGGIKTCACKITNCKKFNPLKGV